MSHAVLPDTLFSVDIVVRTVEKTKLLPLFLGNIGHMLYRGLMDQWISPFLVVSDRRCYSYGIVNMCNISFQLEQCTYVRILSAVRLLIIRYKLIECLLN